jgi:methylmalonyl-CoA mutase
VLDTTLKEPRATVLIPGARVRYLAEIAEQGRGINAQIVKEADAADRAQAMWQALHEVEDPKLPKMLSLYEGTDLLSHIGTGAGSNDRSLLVLRQRYQDSLKSLSTEAISLLREWPQRLQAITDEHFTYEVRGKSVEGNNYVESLSHQKVPKIAAPTYKSWGELLTFLMRENLPGAYPYTGGVYPYRRTGEDPTRMFAGEGTPERTNRRFHYLSLGQKAARLSTAFDSVTLYGEDPAPRPDIYGKIGNSGVSIATLDDMKKLYSGFDLSSPTTSVSGAASSSIRNPARTRSWSSQSRTRIVMGWSPRGVGRSLRSAAWRRPGSHRPKWSVPPGRRRRRPPARASCSAGRTPSPASCAPPPRSSR